MPFNRKDYHNNYTILSSLMLRICLLSVLFFGFLFPAVSHVHATEEVSSSTEAASNSEEQPADFHPDVPGSTFTKEGIRYVLKEDLTLSIAGYDTDYFTNLPIHTLYLRNTVDDIPVTSIEPMAFSDFSIWVDLYIDDNISIGKRAFANLRVRSTTIGSSSHGYNEIGKYAFYNGQPGKTTILSNVILRDSCFYNTHFDSLSQPESSTLSIGAYAFYCSSYNGGLNLDSVTEIGDYAFDLTACLEFTIPASLQSVGTDAFPSQEFRPSHAAYRIFHISPEVTDISRFSIADLTKETILYLDAESPLIPYCQENGIAFALTTDPEEPKTGQVVTTDTCMFMITGEHSAKLLESYAKDLILNSPVLPDRTFKSSPYLIPLHFRAIPFRSQKSIGEPVQNAEN